MRIIAIAIRVVFQSQLAEALLDLPIRYISAIFKPKSLIWAEIDSLKLSLNHFYFKL